MRLTPERHALALRRIALAMCLCWIALLSLLLWRVAC